ncbi:CSNK1G [Lepeophtheirus salmonis]|uniref:CSNK1G n=1 Tax=Lepeophtheirus salmonis TaxID=72036 RepID=A0A7R8D6F3_LEPSM|nr:CSNK1G [Lepeophtheirus salmonis]CAF3015529.1 CSNK1G [Lepeophtheirus salmonis]
MKKDKLIRSKNGIKKIGDTKRATPIEVLCENHPEELATYLRYVRRLDFFETPDYEYLRKLFQDLQERKGYVDEGEFDWTGRNMQTPEPRNNTAWSESKPSGIDALGPRLTSENRHPSVQVVRGSTNIDLSRGGDDDGATADRSNAPITTNADVDVVDETKFINLMHLGNVSNDMTPECVISQFRLYFLDDASPDGYNNIVQK